MNNSNNIVLFPGSVRQDEMPIPNKQEIDQNIEMVKQYHIQEAISNIAPMIFNNLDIAGFTLSEDDSSDIKDGAFIVESLRSLMCKYYGLYHPFQILADKVFQQDTIEVGVLHIVDELNIKLKDVGEM
jgi:hypothetical protein